jgi:hypothetical protein
MPNPKVKGSISNGTSQHRDVDDFYETPSGFTRALLKRQSFYKRIWEPAAGTGAISNVLLAAGYKVLSTDLFPRAEQVSEADFFNTSYKGYDIITNPPFKLLIPFVIRGFKLCHQKLALVMPISGLNSSSRYQAIWSKLPVSNIYLSGRYQKVMSARGLISSQFSHIWVVFDRGHEGPPTFEWLPDVIYSGSISQKVT